MLFLTLAIAIALAASAAGEEPPRRGDNPITLDGQISDVSRDGDMYVFRLIRQKYPVVASPVTRVRGMNGERLYVGDLRARDVVHVSGNLNRVEDERGYVIRADRIVLQLREEHRR